MISEWKDELSFVSSGFGMLPLPGLLPGKQEPMERDSQPEPGQKKTSKQKKEQTRAQRAPVTYSTSLFGNVLRVLAVAALLTVGALFLLQRPNPDRDARVAEQLITLTEASLDDFYMHSAHAVLRRDFDLPTFRAGMRPLLELGPARSRELRNTDYRDDPDGQGKETWLTYAMTWERGRGTLIVKLKVGDDGLTQAAGWELTTFERE